MEVQYEGFDTGEIVGAEILKQCSGGANGGCGLLVWSEGETPEAWGGVFAPASEDGFILVIVDDDGVFGERDGTVGIAKFSNTDEGVGEVRHNVSRFGGTRWKLGEVQFASGGQVLNIACGGTNPNGWGGGIDVSAVHTRFEVVVARTCVGNCGVAEGQIWWMTGRWWLR